LKRFAALLLIVSVLSCGNCRRSVNSIDAGVVSAPREWLEGTPLADTAPPQPGGTLVVRVMSEPTTLNFLEGNSRESWTSRMTHRLVTESLLEIDSRSYELAPGLAERWLEAENHQVTTFYLRAGVTFHDGTPFTAGDVVATLDAIKDPKQNTAAARAGLGALSAWRALDPLTVQLRWSTPSPFALRELAKLPILPAKAMAKDWLALAEHPIGTGPFAVDTWERGRQLTLRRVDPARAHVERIIFRFVKDHTIATGLFDRGELDLLTNVQPSVWKELERSPSAIAETVRLKGIDNSYSYIAWNEAVPALADVRVRRALAHLYPAHAMSKTVDLGLELPTTCPFWLPSESCDSSVEPISFSAAEARAELLDAGFVDTEGVLTRDGQPLRLHFLMPATSVRLAKLAPMLQEQFRRVGAELVVETVDVSQMGARVNARDFEVVSRVMTELDAVQDQLVTFHSSQIDGGANIVRYASPEADRLMEAIRREWEAPARHALERDLHRRLHEDQPYLFMTSRSSLDLAKRRVHGLSPSPLWYDLRVVWVEH